MTMNINAATIVEALGGNPATGMCKCPAHDDRKPSLHVTDGEWRVLVNCFAGCSPDAVIQALRGRGLWPERQANTGKKAQANDNYDQDELWRIEKAIRLARTAYFERSPDITPVTYLKNRGINIVPPNANVMSKSCAANCLDKRFPAMVSTIIDDFDDNNIIGAHVTFLTLDGTARIAGDTPRLTRGKAKGGFVVCGEPDPEKPLIIGEGIETTLSAMQLAGGLPGIAGLSAANLPAIRKLPPCTEVIIAADNDDPGRKAAAQLAERLEYEGRKVRIALPPVDDDDWNDRLLRSVSPVAEWAAAAIAETKTAAKEPNDSNSASGSIAALELGEFLNLTFPERELLLAPWLPKPGLVMIHAPRGGGKTYFALSAGNAIARGTEFCGWPARRARVLYVDGELPGDFLQQRLNKLPPGPEGQFYVLSRDTFLLRRQLMPNLSDADGRAALNTIIEQCEPDLLILDSLSTLVRGGIENEAESWAPIQDWLLNWRWKGLSTDCRRSSTVFRAFWQPRGTQGTADTCRTKDTYCTTGTFFCSTAKWTWTYFRTTACDSTALQQGHQNV
jgi:putative DNA primase/helicase